MVESVLAAGLQGIQAGVEKAQDAANNISNVTTTDSESPQSLDLGSLAESAVDLKVAEQQVAASAAVLKTADEMIGNLVDVKA